MISSDTKTLPTIVFYKYINSKNGKSWEKTASYYKQLHFERLLLCIKPSQEQFCQDVKVGLITFPNICSHHLMRMQTYLSQLVRVVWIYLITYKTKGKKQWGQFLKQQGQVCLTLTFDKKYHDTPCFNFCFVFIVQHFPLISTYKAVAHLTNGLQ